MKFSLKSRGASVTAYGLMVGLVAIVALGATQSTGGSVTNLFGKVATTTGDVVSGSNAALPQASASTGPALYAFTSHNFSECSATGLAGPTLAACRSSYSTSWDEDPAFFNMTSQGIQEWTVPETATYRITAYGAQGGTNTGHSCAGGHGASMRGDFSLVQGEVLKILVGQVGESCDDCAGGGGGSFVTDFSNNPLIIAGGGAGGAEEQCLAIYIDASATTAGKASPKHGGASAVCNGNQGQVGYGGCHDGTSYSVLSSGAGLLSGGTGGDGSQPTLAKSFLDGGNGCDENNYSGGLGNGGDGGFGGGGCGQQDGSGGAGGYSGGESGSGGGSPDGPGGGGGSFNSGTNQSNTAAGNTGMGHVQIEKL